MLNRSKIWWRLRERHLWNVTLLPCKPRLSFNVLDGYVLNKTWLLALIFRRNVRYFPFLFFPCTHLTNSRILTILYFGWICIHGNTHTVTLAKSFLTKWALVAVVFWVADESDILLMVAVVLPPLPPGALQEVCLLPGADHIIQPDGPGASFWGALFVHTCAFPIPAQHRGMFWSTVITGHVVLKHEKGKWYSWGNKDFSIIPSKLVQLALNSMTAPYAASSVMGFL